MHLAFWLIKFNALQVGIYFDNIDPKDDAYFNNPVHNLHRKTPEIRII